MVYIYYSLIKARPQRRTYEGVPDHLKADVAAMLEANGYDLNGDPLVD